MDGRGWNHLGSGRSVSFSSWGFFFGREKFWPIRLEATGVPFVVSSEPLARSERPAWEMPVTSSG